MARFLFSMFLALLGGSVAAQVTVRIGSYVAIPAIFEPIKAHFEKDRGIKMVFSELGAVDNLLALEAGRLDVSVAGSTMEGWLDLMKAKGHPVKPAYDYKHCVIGEDWLSVLVNPDVLTDASMLITTLDKAAIKNMFVGKYKNWKDVGGPDLPIVVVVWAKNTASNKEFQEKALDGEPFAPGHLSPDKSSYADLIECLRTTRGAIGIGPLVMTRNSRIWSPEQAPKFQRPLTMVVADNPSPEMRKAIASLLEYIQGPGKKYLP